MGLDLRLDLTLDLRLDLRLDLKLDLWLELRQGLRLRLLLLPRLDLSQILKWESWSLRLSDRIWRLFHNEIVHCHLWSRFKLINRGLLLLEARSLPGKSLVNI